MAIPLTINGAVFEYPQSFDEDWGIDATGWAQAVTNGALYLSGGNFPLTALVDFGTSFGMKVKSITTETASPSTSGYIALAHTDTIGWRNNAHGGDLLLAVNSSDMLTFNGSALGLTSLTNSHIYVGNASNVPTDVAMSGDATIANTGALTIANSAITNAKVSATAAIAVSKLAALSNSQFVVTNGSGVLVSQASPSLTEIGYVAGVTSAIQTQIGTLLPLAGGTMSGPISMASNKITSLSFGTVAGDAAAFGQLNTNAAGYIIGTVLQSVQVISVTSQTVSSTFTVTDLTASITPKATTNKIRISVSGQLQTNAGTQLFATVARNGTNLGSSQGFMSYTNVQATGASRVPCAAVYLDAPSTTSATTYAVYARSVPTLSGTWNSDGVTAVLLVEEIAA